VTPSKRLAALFGVALLGVLVAGGLLVAALGGLPAVLGYVAVAAVLLGLGVARARRLAPPPTPARVQHCTCCDGDHTAPVQVV